MATLIPEISLSDFKKLNSGQIKQLKSCEIYSDGEYICTLIVPQTPYIRTQSEYMAQLSNAIGGKHLEALCKKEKGDG